MNSKFLNIVMHPFKFRLFLLYKLPSAYFSGVRVRYLDDEKCAVTVPYKWFSQNPFKSTYFACLAMAAEMSTGVLAMSNTYGQKPAVSMLVLKVEGDFYKKANSLTTFICEDGQRIAQVIKDAIVQRNSTIITAHTIGKNKEGQVVANFAVTWSFKAKSK
ncbi:MAG: DUF4442 domain-containing protein [Bacteroidetes bacterium]|nr:DUF4442 domain-containing protein [Bacteroidota bacterium]MBS1757157.1 DUF4442 domain-containing protein [Bacteroidota bacterium]